MSRGFDQSVEASWGRFEEGLLRRLERLGEGSFDVAVTDVERDDPYDGTVPFVRFVGRGEELTAQVSGNRVLDREFRLTRSQQQALRALGWSPPGDGAVPHWWVTVPREVAPVAASMVVSTLRKVFAVVSPEFLCSLGSEPGPVDAPAEGEAESFRMGWPESRAELEEMLARALREHYGADDEEAGSQDEDGDFPLSFPDTSLWLTVDPRMPGVIVWSFLAWEVRNTQRALVELNILNRSRAFLRFGLDGGRIVVRSDLEAHPLTAWQLQERIDLVLGCLRAERQDFHDRVNGPYQTPAKVRRPEDVP